MADFAALEEQDGIRLSWNIWPNSRIEATKAVIPFASIYTPNKRLPYMQVAPNETFRGLKQGSTLQQLLNCSDAQLHWQSQWDMQRTLSATGCGCTVVLMPSLAALPQVMPYDPVPCKSCGAILNSYARVDFSAGIWSCPFCHTRNHFPAHYRGISEQVRSARPACQAGQQRAATWPAASATWLAASACGCR